MRRREAVAALGLAVVMVAAGVAWLTGPVGLILAGCVLGVCTLILNAED